MKLKRKFDLPFARFTLAGATLAIVVPLLSATHASLGGDATENQPALPAAAQSRDCAGACQAATRVRGVARGKVEIEGGLYSVAWDGNGTVKSVLVSEGDQVEAGTPVAELERQSERYAVDQARAHLAFAKNAHTIISTQLPYAKTLERRLKEGVATGGIDAQRLSDAREKLNVLSLRLIGAQAEIDVATQALNAATWEFDRRLLRSPGAGQVVGVHARVGQSLASGVPSLFLVMPAKPRYVRAEVNEYFVDAISPGMHAVVSQDITEGSSEKSVEGKVLRVAPAYRAGVFDEPSEHGNARVVDVIVSLPSSSDLKLGQPVKVKFHE